MARPLDCKYALSSNGFVEICVRIFMIAVLTLNCSWLCWPMCVSSLIGLFMTITCLHK